MKKKLWILPLIISSIALTSCSLIKLLTTPKTNFIQEENYENAFLYEAGNHTYELEEGEILETINVYWYAGAFVIEDYKPTEENNKITITDGGEFSDTDTFLMTHSYYHDGILDIRFWEAGMGADVQNLDKYVYLSVPYFSTINFFKAGGNYTFEIGGNPDLIKMTSEDYNAYARFNFVKAKEVYFTGVRIYSYDYKVEKTTFIGYGGIDIRNAYIKEMLADNSELTLTPTFYMECYDAENIIIKQDFGAIEMLIPGTGASVRPIITGKAVFTHPKYYRMEVGRYIFGEGKANIDIYTQDAPVHIKNSKFDRDPN